MFDETNVGLAQDTSRQFDWVNIIYSDFAPSTIGSGASVSQPKNLDTAFQFKFVLEIFDIAFVRLTIRERSVITATCCS